MGEVWRARDQKLGREVAIKTLPEEFAKDEERLARFEREAKLLASLNHPNIAAIYGLEEDNGTRFLVLELIEGDTLADRLKRGAIPVEESLTLALQIAEALEAAHEKGVIHRDLKPANIKVTPDARIKVLDFGLAKAFAGDGAEATLSQSPTLSMAATEQGVILGTAAYMSPEQARGQEVDKRADVWAFGVVLFEMLTGRGTFDGGTVSDVLAGVLRADPDWGRLPPNLHPRIRFLLERCLEKESRDRYGDISDARVDIQKVLADPNGVIIGPAADIVHARRPNLPWIAAIVFATLVAALATWNLKPEPPPEPKPVSRFPLLLPEGQAFTRPGRPLVAISPDGTQFAYVANQQLYLRNLDEMEARPIPGTDENVTSPFFSPDGEWIGFYSGADLQLKKIEITGGASIKLCDAENPLGVSWTSNGSILFAQTEGILRVSENGGEPQLLIATADGEQAASPSLLPAGDTVLFSLTSATGEDRWDEGQVVVESLATGDRKVVIEGGGAGRYVPTGHVVYALENVLLAAPFDLGRMEKTGGAVAVVDRVRRAFGPRNTNTPISANYDFSNTGTLVHLPDVGALPGIVTLALVDRHDGTAEELMVPPAAYRFPRISPDGRRLLVTIRDPGGDGDIWVHDLSGGAAPRRLTFEGNNDTALWSPDGKRITFTSVREGETGNLYEIPADGTGVPELLDSSGENPGPWSWTRDGQFLLYTDVKVTGDLWTLRAEDNETALYYKATGLQFNGAFSPDGKWVAYQSNETGQGEIWVQPFPETGAKTQVTDVGGAAPLWSPDGRELFYVNEVRELVSVAVSTESGFTFSLPERLPVTGFLLGARNYDIMPGGDQFLVVRNPERTVTPQINIILNWFEDLRERVPVP